MGNTSAIHIPNSEFGQLSKSKLISIHKKEARRIYEDASFLIILPTTYESMQIYGYGSTWCVTSDDQNIYDSYSDHPMFVIIIKGQKECGYQEKYLLQFETNGIVDINTENVPYDDFFTKYPMLTGIFRRLITGNITKEYSAFEKDYFVNILLRDRITTPA